MFKTRILFLIVCLASLQAAAQTGNVGIGTTSPMARLHVADSSVVFSANGFVNGLIGNPPIEGAGKRMMWFVDKAAFRVGHVWGSNWDKDNIGDYSFASGDDNLASGIYTTAMGLNGTAKGWYSFVAGVQNTALSTAGIAMGNTNEARNMWSVAIGSNLITKPLAGITLGINNDTSDIQYPEGSGQFTDRLFQLGNGFGATRSNAITVLKNGNSGIGVLNPTARLQVDSNVLFTGNALAANASFQSPAKEGKGTRLLWYPEKGAVRFGTIDDGPLLGNVAGGYATTQWDKNNIGRFSMAAGYNTLASGQGNFAAGLNTNANGANGAVAMGNYSTASGEASFALGYNTNAIGASATSLGYYNNAAGFAATSMGYFTRANGIASTSMGNATIARGENSASLGYQNIARSNNSLVAGLYNDTTNTNRLFEIGNGTSSNSRSNAFTVITNGNIGIGTTSPTSLLNVNGQITVDQKNFGGYGGLLLKGNIPGSNYPNIGFSVKNSSATDVVAALISGDLVNNTAGAETIDLSFQTSQSGQGGIAEKMRIKGNGNIGIGTTNPAKQLEVIGAASATPVTLVIGNRGGFGPTALEFVSDYGFGNQWRPGYIKNNDAGNFTGALEFYTNGTGATNLYGNVKGLEVRNGTALTATGTVGNYSDVRLKNNITPFTDGLNVINKINPVQFYYNTDAPFNSTQQQTGIIAQELEKVAPYMVEKNKQNGYDDLRSVNNQAYTFLLINAVKEQQQQLTKQQQEIDELKKLVSQLLKK
jgi:hypothetical protein